MRFARLILTLATLGCLASFTTGCAGAPPQFCPRPSSEYFRAVEKPQPRSDKVRDVLVWAAELSASWDLIYVDRLKAGQELDKL